MAAQLSATSGNHADSSNGGPREQEPPHNEQSARSSVVLLPPERLATGRSISPLEFQTVDVHIHPRFLHGEPQLFDQVLLPRSSSRLRDPADQRSHQREVQ